MEREEIRKSIEYLLVRAWEKPNEARYYLEQLPQGAGDYDKKVHDCISKLAYQIKKENREYEDYDYYIEELIEHYYINQEDYSEFNNVQVTDTNENKNRENQIMLMEKLNQYIDEVNFNNLVRQDRMIRDCIEVLLNSNIIDVNEALSLTKHLNRVRETIILNNCGLRFHLVP